MSYIEIKEETVQVRRLTCSHPMVTKIWEYGGMDANPSNREMFRYVCLLLNDGTTKEFQDNGNGDAIKEAEKYLQAECKAV